MPRPSTNSAFGGLSSRTTRDIVGGTTPRVYLGDAGADWSAEKVVHDDKVSSRNTKYGILMALAGVLGYFGVAKGGIASLFSKWFGGKDSDYDDVIYNLGEDDENGELAQLLKSYRSDNSYSLADALKNIAGKDNSFSFSGLFNGLGSALGGLTSQLGSSWLNMKNMEKLIDKQNEYNTPANQMQRFADAGLNPNLVYGLGSNGNQPASGSVAPVDFDTSQRENRLAKMQIETQSALANSEIAERQSRVNLNNEQANAQKMQNNVFLEGWTNSQNLVLKEIETQIEETRKRRAEADTEEAKALYSKDIARLEKELLDKEKQIADIRAQWAETGEFTSAIGNILHIGLGLNFGYNRGRSFTTTSKK